MKMRTCIYNAEVEVRTDRGMGQTGDEICLLCYSSLVETS